MHGAAAINGLLNRADAVKTSNHGEFTAILQDLQRQSSQLTPEQQQFLRYLAAWQSVYDGEYDTAIRELRSIAQNAEDVTLQFRAGSTLVNVLAFATQHEEAFSRLSALVEMLPQIENGDAREQGLGVAALLYNQVGEYDLGLSYAQQLVEENWAGRGTCKGGQLELEALYKSDRVQDLTPQIQSIVDSCIELGEVVRANLIRSYMARLLVRQKHHQEAIKLLAEHYDEVRQTGSPRFISEFDALLAQAYWSGGELARARQLALRATQSSVKNQYTEPLAIAYRLLYEIAKSQGDADAALAYHEKYASADKGYLDDVSARQLAYQRASHDAVAKKLQIDALNKRNEVLQLQQALDRKAAETGRLYIALLITVLAFIALWAYRTKRSQLHFMKLSQVDGLTGIANRPHFMQEAERVLEASRKVQEEVCVVLCDLDHFKSINDKYGHATGDFVLKQAVASCRAHLRGNDLFGRFGGEEFGILLPGCSLADARQRCEQLRNAIAAVASDAGSMIMSVSASFGVATTTSSGYELRQLLAHADAALYRAKNDGRNCVVLHDGMSAGEDEGEGTTQNGGSPRARSATLA